MAEWPTRGQMSPDFWDDDLRTYIDEADTEAASEAQAAATAAGDAQTTADAAGLAAAGAQSTANTALDNAAAAQSTASAAGGAIVNHIADKANPHETSKAQVGLGNVDNTSDAAKPVSTAQQTALNLKAPLVSPTFTGDPKAPTPATSDNDTSIATTAYVKAQGYAPIASPGFTGNPTAPTPTLGDNDTSLATTAFVQQAVANAPASASSALIVVNGAAQDLDNTKPDGFLIGYRVTATTAIEGVTFPPGTYIFERNTSVNGGWTYRTLATPAQVIPDPDPTAPTAPTLTVNNRVNDRLTATVTGGTDNIAVTKYRTRIDGGAWTEAAAPMTPRAFTGLVTGSSHTIDAQAGDAAGNWSVSTSWTGTTYNPAAITAIRGWWDADDASTFTFSSGVAVSQWRDKSGQTRHFSQATALNQPQRSGAQGGRTTVVFDGINDILRTAAFTQAQAMTIFFVADFPRETGMGLVANNVAGSLQVWNSPPSNVALQGSNGTFIQNPSLSDSNVAEVFTIVLNGASSSISYRGASTVSGNTGTGGTTDGLVIGNQGGDSPFKGEFMEMLLFTGTLSAGDVTNVTNYLIDKWGIV